MSAWEANGKSDEWYTPRYIFDALCMVYDLDVAAPEERTHCSVPAGRFLTSNSLESEWKGFIWMNPPFGGRGNKDAWLNKFFQHGNGVALTPDRSSAPWWQDAARKCDAVLFVKGKIKFIRPDGSVGESPSTGTTLFASGHNGLFALKQGEKNGLGITLTNK